MGLAIPPGRIVTSRILILIGGFAPLCLAIVAVFFGYTTPVEALVLGALILIAFHAWLIRAL